MSVKFGSFHFGPTNCVPCTGYMEILSTVEAGHQWFAIIHMVPQEQCTDNTLMESVPCMRAGVTFLWMKQVVLILLRIYNSQEGSLDGGECCYLCLRPP